MHQAFTYTLVRSNRRSIGIQIEPTGKVVVKAPYLVPKFLVDRFVASKREWIEKKLTTVRAFPLQIKKTIEEGDTYYYLGNSYLVHIGSYKKIEVADTLQFPSHLVFRGKSELTDWYKNWAKTMITDRVKHYCQVMNTTIKSIYFSDTTSKWGSCAPDNTLQFNWRLVMAPMLVIDYVVVHELAHTKEKNHGKRFWHIVSTYKPAYKQYVKWLRLNGNKLQMV